jgi:hypothetical protein
MTFAAGVCMQALDERRLVVEVDMRGVVQAIVSTTTPGTLFGFEPQKLMGKSLGDVVDVLHVEGKQCMDNRITDPVAPAEPSRSC